MSSYLLKILILLLFSFIIIIFYYLSPWHNDNFNGYAVYLILIWWIYLCYKIFQYFWDKKNIVFTPASLLWYFLLHLFVLCGFFFVVSGDSFATWLVLFFKILFYSILPTIIIFTSLGLWKKIIESLLGKNNDHSEIFNFIVSLGIWCMAFVSVLSICGFFWFYSISSLWLILLLFTAVWYKQIWWYIKALFNYKIVFQSHNSGKNILEKINTKLLSAEFFFFVITLIISVNLISIMRPFPIGWDDLGAYMNYPQLMAESGWVGFLGSMMSWSVFTGIGYLFNNPVQAFFMNNVGWVLSVIVLIAIISDILKTSSHKLKNTFIHIPTLIGALFISMPMIVFQQAKDMKIDPGLFFFSIISVYILYKIFSEKFSQKQTYILYLIIWILAGFIFTIKFTSLFTIISIFGLIFYKYLWVWALTWYLALFVWIFTKLWLWNYMNVVYPKDDIEFKNNVLLGSLLIWFLWFWYAFKNYKKIFSQICKYIIIVWIGIIIWILPWLWNNIITAEKIGVSEILSWTPERFVPDYSQIYTPWQLDEIEQNKITWRWLTSSGTTSNEDWGRYFWYEKGINNYIKLPWNLTMQVNQGWEFTNIWWFFLALLPWLFLFLPSRKWWLSIWVITLLVLELALFLYKPTSLYLTWWLSSFQLPLWYLILLLSTVLPVIWLIFWVNSEKKYMKLFIYNLIFSSIYIFLWAISAFGIVWYGILMYFNMLLMIAISLYYLCYYKEDDSDKKIQIKFFGSIVMMIILGVWFLNSVIPHGLNNLKNASYKQFKTWEITTVNAPFLYHREYLSILFALNIAPGKFDEFIQQNVDTTLLQQAPDIGKYKIENSVYILNQIVNNSDVDFTLRQKAQSSIDNIYESILRPQWDFKNTQNIYRVGTFLKYFITQNNVRLYEDSLLNNFQTYLYWDNIDTTVDNMKKIWLSYLLVDLNAATIDNDPAKNLTRRVDNMFETFTSDKLELIETDSICLKLALDDFKQYWDLKKYTQTASVNHNSPAISRWDKFKICHSRVFELIQENEVSQASYSYLLPIQNYLSQNKITSPQEIQAIIPQAVKHGAKVLFRIK